MTITPTLSVPLPAGAVYGDNWEGDAPERVVTGPRRGITDTHLTVWTSAIQRADGRINTEQEPPLVHIDDQQREGPLNSNQARGLAAILLEAADEMEKCLR
jgi:hypothetical protein